MHSVSPKHKRNLNQWYKDIKKQLTSKAHENFFKRLQEIISIANNKLQLYDHKLSVDGSNREKMWSGIANDINSWKGVEITACTKQKTNYKSYAITSRNWWNRNKAKVYGNHFFYPIIFVYIKQAVQNLSINEKEKSFLFVDIFDEILHAKIQFPQTRAQPIIPHQSFIQPNKFKYSSIDLLKTNGIHWTGKNIDSLSSTSTTNGNSNSNSNATNNGRFSDDDSTSTNSNSSTTSNTSSNSNSSISNTCSTVQRQSYYVKDKDRSLKVNNSFMDSLEILKHRLHQVVINDNSHSNNNSKFKLKIKTEPQLPACFKIENCTNNNNNNNNIAQCLPPSIIKAKQEIGINMASIAAQSLLSNANLNNNHNPVVVSPPHFNAPYPPSINIQPITANGIKHMSNQIGNIADMNHINNINITNTNNNANNNNTSSFSFPVSPNNSQNNILPTLDMQALINSIANNNTATAIASPQSINSNTSNNNADTSPQSMNALVNSLLIPNQLNYNASRGQTNSVSMQRFSPNMFSNVLPFNLQNIPNSYCSINTNPVSGQLTLSLHIPLN